MNPLGAPRQPNAVVCTAGISAHPVPGSLRAYTTRLVGKRGISVRSVGRANNPDARWFASLTQILMLNFWMGPDVILRGNNHQEQMSALGQKQICAVQLAMSAMGQKQT
jgi:hypothetical protein